MTHAGGARAPAGKWAVAGTVVLGSFVAAMDVSIVNVAMPQMIGTFGVPLDAITWVAVAYSIAEIIMVTLAAWFCTLLGRQRFYTLSLALFIAASVLCGFARSLEMMIVGRVLQGIGGGSLIPLSQAILLEAFPEEERGMAMALYMMGGWWRRPWDRSWGDGSPTSMAGPGFFLSTCPWVWSVSVWRPRCWWTRHMCVAPWPASIWWALRC